VLRPFLVRQEGDVMMIRFALASFALAAAAVA
jgi:hypothetical protein